MGRKNQTLFVGERYQMGSGLWLTIVSYQTAKKITVRFDESGFEAVVEAKQIRCRNIEDPLIKYPQAGSKYILKNGDEIEVVRYGACNDILIRFIDTGFETVVEHCQIKRGTIQDHLKPSYLGVGCIGSGVHRVVEPDGKSTWACTRWTQMLRRCLEPKQPNYVGCSFVEEWKNFQNFAEWASQQIGYEEEGWHMDKDVLVKGNKLYSPDTCLFLPQDLNGMLVTAKAIRGDLPIGVSLHKSNGKYVAHVHGTGNSGYVGIYETPEEAFANYKRVKEIRIKEKANKWRGKIDPRAYEALMNYEVEITD